MSQSRAISLAESVTNVVAGFAIALVTQIVLFQAMDLEVTLVENVGMTMLFSSLSLIRLHRPAHFKCIAASAFQAGALYMRGRKPTPSHVKKLLGNPGKRPINDREPKPKLELPSCSSHLMPTAKAEWKRFVQSNSIGDVAARQE